MLVITRSTASTVKYTVSTRAPATTITRHVLDVILLSIRLIGAIAAVLTLTWQYDTLFATEYTKNLLWTDLNHAGILPGKLIFHDASTINHIVILTACVVTIWLVFHREYTEESLLVIRGLGVQTSTSSSSYLMTSSTRFIPATAIQDIFLHEAFIGFQVKYYLSIVVEGEDKVVIVFPTILPRFDALETVWRGARACLYGPKT